MIFLFTLLLFAHACTSSVLPKPNYRPEAATTQLSLEGTGTIVLVTSSELPKQIPPPPTPTRPHEATPRYETPGQLWITKTPPQTYHSEGAPLLGNFI